MAARLTTFSKFLLTLLIVGSIVGGIWYFLNKTEAGQQIKEKTAEVGDDNVSDTGSSTSSERSEDDDVLRVQLVTWGGYGPGLYFNEGHLANEHSRYFKDYGFKVEFKIENDLINALNAWMAGEYDVLVQTADAFPLYTAPDDINSFEPKAFMQVDWSRGGDALIVKRGINTVNDLKGKRIAVAVPSPAQTLLITSLEAAGLDYEDVTVIKTADNLKAAELFRSEDVDAAVVWSPDDIFATQDVAGSKILLTTVEQSNIIADIMFAKQSYIDANTSKIHGFYEGWMKAVAELEDNPSNQAKAAKYLGDINQMTAEDGAGMASVVHWTSHGDNKDFFGLSTGYRGQRGQDLYTKMSRKFVETEDATEEAPPWRSVIYTGAVSSANLVGAQYGPEKARTFEKKASDATLPAFAAKPVSINFASGAHTLTDNAKTIIDLQFRDIVKSFGGVKVRVEGNTDSDGSKALNNELSRKRANSVANYLKTAYGVDGNRLVVVGNGSSKPVPGCEANQNDACKAKNRRTEFQLIAG